MIKALTVVQATPSSDTFERLTSLLSALGFEAGRGWSDDAGRGSAFLAPIGNLELVSGRVPATPRILVEVTALEQVRTVVLDWHRSTSNDAALQDRSDGGRDLPGAPSDIQDTHWNSRMFSVEVDSGFEIGFWESTNPLHGRPIAVEGDLSAKNKRFAVVVARWNAVITDRLLQGSLDALTRSGARLADIRIVRVPGAWEIPSASRTLAESGDFNAIITLGVLLRGETAHYEAIYNEVARGIGQSQQETGVPHAFGVLTCETLEQALDRAGLKAGNKGFEAGMAAIEMASIREQLVPANEEASR